MELQMRKIKLLQKILHELPKQWTHDFALAENFLLVFHFSCFFRPIPLWVNKLVNVIGRTSIVFKSLSCLIQSLISNETEGEIE